jgi:hypothetical protein
MGQIYGLVGGINSNPEKLIQGFGTASLYSSQGATQRGYGESKLFTFTVGSIVGIKVGSSLGDILQDPGSLVSTLQDDIKNKGDATLGLNIQGMSGQFNINTGRFLPFEGLDLGLRFGYFKQPDSLLSGLACDSFSVGVVGSYHLLKEKTLVPVVLKWRGLSLGTGVIFQHSNTSYAMELDTINQPLGGSYTSTSINIDPKLVFDMKTETVTVPLEVTTAIQLFSFLNITLGAGVDFGFGKNTVEFGLDADVNLDDLPVGVTQDKAGSLSVSGGGEMAPQFFNFKVMTGVGFKIGPVILDVPVTWYPGPGNETGLSVGMTFGLTF